MKGFTLIETLVVLAATLLLGATLASVYNAVSTLYGYEKALRSATDAAGAIRQAVADAVVPARRVLASRTFAAGAFSSGTTTLVLEAPAIDAGGSVLTGRYDYTAFYVATATVYRLVEPDASSARRAGTTALGETAALAFTYDNASFSSVAAVTLDVSASSSVKGSTAASRLTEVMRLRNK